MKPILTISDNDYFCPKIYLNRILLFESKTRTISLDKIYKKKKCYEFITKLGLVSSSESK